MDSDQTKQSWSDLIDDFALNLDRSITDALNNYPPAPRIRIIERYRYYIYISIYLYIYISIYLYIIMKQKNKMQNAGDIEGRCVRGAQRACCRRNSWGGVTHIWCVLRIPCTCRMDRNDSSCDFYTKMKPIHRSRKKSAHQSSLIPQINGE